MSYNVYSSLGHGPWGETPPHLAPLRSRPVWCWFLLVCSWAQPPTARGRQGPARAAAPTPVQRSGHHGPTALLIVKHFRSARSMENNRPPGTRLTIVRCEKIFQIRGRPPGVLAETTPPRPSLPKMSLSQMRCSASRLLFAWEMSGEERSIPPLPASKKQQHAPNDEAGRWPPWTPRVMLRVPAGGPAASRGPKEVSQCHGSSPPPDTQSLDAPPRRPAPDAPPRHSTGCAGPQRHLPTTVSTSFSICALMEMRPRRSVWSVPQRLGTFITQRLCTFIMQAARREGRGSGWPCSPPRDPSRPLLPLQVAETPKLGAASLPWPCHVRQAPAAPPPALMDRGDGTCPSSPGARGAPRTRPRAPKPGSPASKPGCP